MHRTVYRKATVSVKHRRAGLQAVKAERKEREESEASRAAKWAAIIAKIVLLAIGAFGQQPPPFRFLVHSMQSVCIDHAVSGGGGLDNSACLRLVLSRRRRANSWRRSSTAMSARWALVRGASRRRGCVRAS